MKKILTLALCLMLAFSCVACNGNNSDGANNGNSNSDGNVANDEFDTNKITFASAYAKAQSLGFEGTLDDFIRLVSGKDGADGKDGKDGVDGKDGAQGADGIGITNVTVDNLGNLLVTLSNGETINCGKVTGKDGIDGKTPYIENGYWYIDGVNTGVKAEGIDGADGTPGADGKTPTIEISDDGYWVINGEKTIYKAVAVNGESTVVEISNDGYWVINGVKTNYKAVGSDGKDGADGKDGKDAISIKNIALDDEGKMVITLTDGTVLDAIELPNNVGHIHSFGEWINYSENSSINCENRLYYHICNICNAVEWQKGTHENHNFETVTVDSTCMAQGYDENTCSVCGFFEKTNYTAITGHNIDDSGYCSVCNQPVASTEGIMYDISADGTYAEAVGYSGTATKIVIADTYEGVPVTGIYKEAFKNNTSITSVVIPDSVTSIGENAFYNCNSSLYTEYEYGKYVGDANNPYAVLIELTNKNLSTYTINENTKHIGYGVFKDCSSLTSITIPYSVTSIGAYAFESCSNLTSVNISDIAAWCNISFYNYFSNPLYYAKNLYLNGELITELVISNSVTSIGAYAFCSCTSLTSVSIGNGVTSIGNSAFSNCTSLTSVTIPDSVTSIGKGVFSNCDGLTSVTIPDSVTSIGTSAFLACSNLTSVSIGNSVTSIGNYAFEHCSALTSVTIGNAVTSIGRYAFDNCTSLKNVYYTGSEEECNAISIGSSNTYLTNATHYYYSETEPTTVGNFWHYVDDVVTVWPEYVAPVYSEGLAFTSNGDGTCYVSGIGTCTDTDLVIPPISPNGDIVIRIASSAFRNCTSFTSVTIPDSVTSIGSFAFDNCFWLTSVTIGNGVTFIGGSAFFECYNLTSVNISDIAAWCQISFASYWNDYERFDSNPLYYADDLYLNGNLVTEIVIPDGVTSISNYAFYSYSRLRSVTIPNSVTSIGYDAFCGCYNLISVNISDIAAWCNISFEYYYDTNYDEYHYESNPLVYAENLYLNGGLITELIIPDGVTSIATCAFYGQSSITSVTIPNSVISIGKYAFCKCINITNITIPDSVTSIGVLAFYNCTNLTSVIIGNGVTSIGNQAFYYCTSLTSVTIPDSVTSIGSSAFRDCTNLKNVYYTGSEEEWKAISIDSWCNDDLTRATKHYNYVPEE